MPSPLRDSSARNSSINRTKGISPKRSMSPGGPTGAPSHMRHFCHHMIPREPPAAAPLPFAAAAAASPAPAAAAAAVAGATSEGHGEGEADSSPEGTRGSPISSCCSVVCLLPLDSAAAAAAAVAVVAAAGAAVVVVAAAAAGAAGGRGDSKGDASFAPQRRRGVGARERLSGGSSGVSWGTSAATNCKP